MLASIYEVLLIISSPEEESSRSKERERCSGLVEDDVEGNYLSNAVLRVRFQSVSIPSFIIYFMLVDNYSSAYCLQTELHN